MTIASRQTMWNDTGKPTSGYWGLCFTAEQTNSTVALVKTNSKYSPAISIEYSTDAETWTPFTIGLSSNTTPITLENVGDKVYFRAGDGGTGGDGINLRLATTDVIRTAVSRTHKFIMTGRIAASGDVTSLLNRERSAEALNSNAFIRLFYGCTSLTTAPDLPSTTLMQYCYYQMFYGCTSLAQAPRLPALSLAPQCYYQMFYGCTSLTAAELPATTLATQCYNAMFRGCSTLSFIDIAAFPLTYASTGMTANWLYGVAASGIIRIYDIYGDDTTLPRNNHCIPAGWTLETKPNTYFSITGGTIKSTSTKSAGLQYSLDCGNTWVDWDGSELNAADSLYMFAAKQPRTSCQSLFNSSSTFTCIGGNLGSLLVKDANVVHITADNAFKSCFANDSSLSSARVDFSRLSLEANNCFESMFSGTSITKAPQLPFTSLTLGCYSSMFASSKLTAAPELPAQVLASNCYSNMFYNCKALTTAPELPAQTLASNCYNSMFKGCTALITTSALSAQTLASSCYSNMFRDCTALTVAPELPAQTLASNCYQYMFMNCTRLTSTPELPATTLANYCYSSMFENCPALVSASNLSATTLYSDCYARMFYGCKSMTTPPSQLPATNGSVSQPYFCMFYGCTSLTASPEIFATQLNGYKSAYGMFTQCSSLSHIKVHLTSWPSDSNSTNLWVYGVLSSGIFECPASLGTDATITRGSYYCPDGWTVVNIA